MTCPATGGEHEFSQAGVCWGCGLSKEAWLTSQLATAQRELEEVLAALGRAETKLAQYKQIFWDIQLPHTEDEEPNLSGIPNHLVKLQSMATAALGMADQMKRERVLFCPEGHAVAPGPQNEIESPCLTCQAVHDRNEAQAACAAMATLLSDCGEWFHDPPEDDGSSDAMLEHRIATLLVSSPGRPLLDELARLREALETVERTYYSTQTVPTPGQEAHVMALVRAAFSARSTP